MSKEPQKNLNFLHPISSLGIKEVSLSGIRVERLEDRLNPKVGFPHKHDFFQLIVMKGGSGKHQIDFVTHRVSAQSIFIMKPGQVHTWELSSRVTGMMIEFNRDAFTRGSQELISVMSDLRSSPDALTIKNAKISDELKSLAEEMFIEFQHPRHYSEVILSYLLPLFVTKLLRQCGETNALKDDDRAERFKILVEENFRQEHRVEFYAKSMASSPKALTMQITRLLGKAPRTIIQDRVLLEARRLLAFSQLSIAEIGFELGFDDSNYFTRFFRQHEKVSPAVFRKKSVKR